MRLGRGRKLPRCGAVCPWAPERVCTRSKGHVGDCEAKGTAWVARKQA